MSKYRSLEHKILDLLKGQRKPAPAPEKPQPPKQEIKEDVQEDCYHGEIIAKDNMEKRIASDAATNSKRKKIKQRIKEPVSEEEEKDDQPIEEAVFRKKSKGVKPKVILRKTSMNAERRKRQRRRVRYHHRLNTTRPWHPANYFRGLRSNPIHEGEGGAGFIGTDELVAKYKAMTPGQEPHKTTKEMILDLVRGKDEENKENK